MGPGCGERQLGEQRCETCRTFTRRIGVGGPCPHCDEPVAVTDLLAQAVITHNQAVIPHPVTTHLGPCPRSPQPGRQFRGHRWAETVATSGQVSWPRVGRNRWPLTSLQDDRRNSGAGSCGDEATRFLSARILHFLAVVRPVLQCNGRTRSGIEKRLLKTGRVSNHDLVSRRTRRWGRTCGNPWTCRGVPTDSAPRCR